MLDTWAPGLKYQSLVPESTMAVLMRALSVAVLVLATCHTERRCSHLSFHLVSGDADRLTAGGRGSMDAATRIFGAGWGDYRKIVLFQ